MSETSETQIPKKYKHTVIEDKWCQKWTELGVYKYDPQKPRQNTFVVDTPPPTVSGSLHVGHVFSYTQTDLMVRYKRMNGMNIFYPMGWDDNGLPTERRVQNIFQIQCDLSKQYESNWKPTPSKKSKRMELVSRPNFIEACHLITKQDEQAFENLYRHLGLSVDWQLKYATINDHCRKTSQLSFMDLYEKGYIYQIESPTMWDVDYRTAVAQAEVEDKEIPGAYYDLIFGVEGGKEFTISTTRPELLAACIAVVAHPDDKRYQNLFEKKAYTPLFYDTVPILPAEHADPEKGTGIMMVCTFGDSNDVEWWKQSKLPLKQIINVDGRLKDLDFSKQPFNSINPEQAQKNYANLAGLKVKKAKNTIAELLKQPGSAYNSKDIALIGDPKPITHPVKFYEKGDNPLEYITTRQWFVKVLDYKQELLSQGRKIKWYPSHMLTRYEHWVEGLNQDWCISRQRFFGVPFPVWYPVLPNGETDYQNPILPDKQKLPVDPLSDTPDGYTEDMRNQPGGFVGDMDVMDTWATSSLTPQIASNWCDSTNQHASLFPFDIRPQAHEIIRTWAFYTIVKAWMHENKVPWKNIAISGWILDPDRKKMSKSKGNVVTPEDLLTEYSSDAIRYWAGKAKLGTDTAYDETVFKIGRRLATKLFNASRFVFIQVEGRDLSEFKLCDIKETLDRAHIEQMKSLLGKTTTAWEKYDYASALHMAEDSFWNFCDHYMELIKNRSYKESDKPTGKSAIATLLWSIKTYLKLFAPTLPFITEEIWSWKFAELENAPSIHNTSWPSSKEIEEVPGINCKPYYDCAVEVLTKIRSFKTEQQKSIKWPVQSLKIESDSTHNHLLKEVIRDVCHAVSAQEEPISFVDIDNKSPEDKDRFIVTVKLSDNPN